MGFGGVRVDECADFGFEFLEEGLCAFGFLEFGFELLWDAAFLGVGWRAGGG